MELVLVKSEIQLDDGVTVIDNKIILSKKSGWRFVKIEPLLLNHERQNHYIRVLLQNPHVEIIKQNQ